MTSHSLIQKLKNWSIHISIYRPQWLYTVITIASYILASLHLHTSHVCTYNNHTSFHSTISLRNSRNHVSSLLLCEINNTGDKQTPGPQNIIDIYTMHFVFHFLGRKPPYIGKLFLQEEKEELLFKTTSLEGQLGVEVQKNIHLRGNWMWESNVIVRRFGSMPGWWVSCNAVQFNSVQS